MEDVRVSTEENVQKKGIRTDVVSRLPYIKPKLDFTKFHNKTITQTYLLLCVQKHACVSIMRHNRVIYNKSNKEYEKIVSVKVKSVQKHALFM